MSEPGSEQLRVGNNVCVYVLESLVKNGDTNSIPFKYRCDNIGYHANSTPGVDSINHTENNVDPYAYYAAYMRSLETTPIVLIKAITMILYSVGLIANVLLLTYIVKFRRYTSPTFAVIFSLGCCDVGTCAYAVVNSVIVIPTLIGPGWLCGFLMWFTAYFYNSSVCHMILFSMLRFCQLLFPLTSRAKITVSLVAKACLCVWLMNIASNVILTTFYTSGSFIYQGKPYTICEVKGQRRNVIFSTMVVLVPNFIITWFHLVKHIIVLHRSKKKVSEQEHGRQTTDGRAVTLVITVYCVSSIPHILHLYAHFVLGLPNLSFHQALYQIDVNMLFGNSALNPWIYVLAARSVRRDILVMLKLR